MIIRCDRQQSFIDRAALLSAVAVFALTSVSAAPRDARAAASAQAPAKVSEVMVYTAADEFSPLIESVRDGGAFSPIAETAGPGGMKWFMVKTKAGNIGWIKASDNAEARKVDDHFRAMPRGAVMIGPASSAPDAATNTSATGAITIPVKINGPRVIVPVILTSGNSSSTGNLLVDTGAAQTMISKRLAREIRLLSIANQTRTGIGGSIQVDVGQVESVKVGEAEVKNMRVSIHDRVYDFGSEGLLGFDFLSRFQMSVDSDKQVMVLTPRKK
jgi:gag-polyprotein putative aspartyl protease